MNDAEQTMKQAEEALAALNIYFERLTDLARGMDCIGLSAGLILDRLITDTLIAKEILRRIVDIAIKEGE